MIKRIKHIVKSKVLGNTTGRHIELFEDDIFLVSYPKSGNTWIRFLLGNIIAEEYDFRNMEGIIPDIYVMNNEKLKSISRPRILKSHEYFHPGYNKVVYIIRDPRSVAVSYYHFLQKFNQIPDDLSFQEYLRTFVKGGYDSYGTWKDNVESWISTRVNDQDRFILLKYEDLLSDTYSELQRLVKFLDIETTDSILRSSIEKSSFSSMRENEKTHRDNIKVFKNTDHSKPFIRSGRTDEWKEVLSDQDLDLINRKFGLTMEKLGYI